MGDGILNGVFFGQKYPEVGGIIQPNGASSNNILGAGEFGSNSNQPFLITDFCIQDEIMQAGFYNPNDTNAGLTPNIYPGSVDPNGSVQTAVVIDKVLPNLNAAGVANWVNGLQVLSSTNWADEPTQILKIKKKQGSNGVQNAWFKMRLLAGRQNVSVDMDGILGEIDNVDSSPVVATPSVYSLQAGTPPAPLLQTANANYTIVVPEHNHLGVIKIAGLQGQAYDLHLGFVGQINMLYSLGGNPYLYLHSKGKPEENFMGFAMSTGAFNNDTQPYGVNNVLLIDNNKFRTNQDLSNAKMCPTRELVIDLSKGTIVDFKALTKKERKLFHRAK